MLSAGRNIQSPNDKLAKVTVEYLYHSIKNPKNEISTKLKQLQIIRELDPKRYSYLKRQLPYVVCGGFNPPFRKKENFTYIEHFIVDLDHLSEKGIDLLQLKQILKQDNRLSLMFISPSGDGLKLLYDLKERCTDSGIYSIFYHKFVNALATQYNLLEAIDTSTSDVSRACFISMDEDAYYNPDAEKINIQDFINLDDTLALYEANKQDNNQRKQDKQTIKQENLPPKDPDDEALLEIKKILGTKIKQKTENTVFVPERLNEIISQVKSFIESHGISVYEIVNIQYAKKIRCKLNNKMGEVNLFYGKKGFSVVQSPASGTSKELNEVIAQIIEMFIEENT